MDKPIVVGQAILDISKSLVYEFWYDYLKPKYQDRVKLCYMDTDSFILQIQTDDFFEDINNDVNKWKTKNSVPISLNSSHSFLIQYFSL